MASICLVLLTPTVGDGPSREALLEHQTSDPGQPSMGGVWRIWDVGHGLCPLQTSTTIETFLFFHSYILYPLELYSMGEHFVFKCEFNNFSKLINVENVNSSGSIVPKK